MQLPLFFFNLISLVRITGDETQREVVLISHPNSQRYFSQLRLAAHYAMSYNSKNGN